MNGISVKHHFVPVFYQRGILSDEEELFAYKKKYKSIKNWSPAKILYREALHTIYIGGRKVTLLEDFYSKVEGEVKRYLDFIHKNIDDRNLIRDLLGDGGFQRISKLIVALQFWRTPCRKDLVVFYAPKVLELYDNADDETKGMLNHDRKFIKLLMKKRKNIMH